MDLTRPEIDELCSDGEFCICKLAFFERSIYVPRFVIRLSSVGRVPVKALNAIAKYSLEEAMLVPFLQAINLKR